MSALFFLPDQSVATSQNLKHDLVGASADRVEPTVAEEPGSPRLFHVTHSAMELEARIGDLTRESARHELRNSRLSDDVLSGLVSLRRLIVVRLQQVNLGGELSQAVSEVLIVCERLPECLPLFDVFVGSLQCPPAGAHHTVSAEHPLNEVFSVTACVLELREYERRFGDGTDPFGAQGDP
ncbi:hypothetical protein, partial [Rhodococcus sp. IEGM1420]